MAIRATCGSCSSTFNARDELAGKKVKCPKCKERMVIPSASAKPAAKKVAKRPAAKPKPKAIDPMEALLKEADIAPVSHGGPICPDCGAEVSQGAIICVDCGFNMETGKRLRTASQGDDGSVDTGLSDAEKIMQKAEAEIEETPVGVDDQDFGDGGDSFVIAGVAGVILMILVAIGLVIIFSMDQVSNYYNSGGISFIASCGIWIGMTIWISYVAFRAKVGHGIACILTGGLYCIVFGFMQGKSMLIPTIIMLIGLVVGLLSGVFVYYKGIYPLEGVHIIDTIDFVRLAWLAHAGR